MTRGVGGHPPSNVQKHLAGVESRRRRRTCSTPARRNGAPHTVMRVLEQLGPEEYGGPQAVMEAYGKIE